MAKNIKDIVDEGFAKLASLAQNRMEILERCRNTAGATTAPHIAAAEEKVKTAEAQYLSEINTQVERLLSDLRQTLAQVSENNQFLQGTSSERLKLHASGFLRELGHSHSYMLKGSTEKLDHLFQQAEREIKSHEALLASESHKLLSELSILSGQNISSLAQAHAEAEGKQTHNQHKLSGGLTESCNKIIQDAEKKRQGIKEKLIKAGQNQNDELTKGIKDLDKVFQDIVQKSLDKMKSSEKILETELTSAADSLQANAASELTAASKESLSQLGESYEYSHKELTESMSAVRELKEKLLQQELKSLSELDSTLRSKADTICAELRAGGGDGESGNVRRNPVEELFAETAQGLNEQNDELKRKISDLLKVQSDAMSKLCAGADKSLLDLFAEFRTQMLDNIKVHEQLCSQKEEELLRQLDKLEMQIADTRKQINSAGNGGPQ